MVHTPPHVTAANIAFHNAIAERYDARLELYHPKVIEHYQQLFNQHVFSRFPEDRQLQVLDVGCGTGYLEQFFKNKNAEIEAMDVSEGMLAQARRKYKESDMNVRFTNRDIFDLPNNPRQFDIVIANSFLHHFKNPMTVVDIMAGKLTPGGALFIGMEPKYSFYTLGAPFISLYRTLHKTHTHVSQDTEIEHLAEYQIFKGRGIHTGQLKNRLKSNNCSGIIIINSIRQTLAKIEDEKGLRLFPIIPSFLLDHFGIFSQLFHTIAYKNQ